MILSFVPDPTSSLWGVLQSLLGLPWWLRGKDSTCNVGHSSSIPGLGRSPGRGHGNSLQYSCLENPHGQRSLAVYSPWHHKQSDTTKRVSTRSVPLPTLSSSHSPNTWVDQISWGVPEFTSLELSWSSGRVHVGEDISECRSPLLASRVGLSWDWASRMVLSWWFRVTHSHQTQGEFRALGYQASPLTITLGPCR